MRTTLRSAFLSPRAAAIALVAALASCSDLLGPEIERQDTPFYYYEDEKIFLRVDGRMLTVVPEAPADTGRIRTVLSRRGLSPDSIRPMQVPGHWLVHLQPATWPRRAEEGARRLRLEEGIRFASVVYTWPDGNCPLYLLHRLAVKYAAGASGAEITRLAAANGLRNEQVDPLGTRLYEYPARMSATPLEFAAHYHRQRIVDWAQPDRLDGCLRIGYPDIRTR